MVDFRLGIIANGRTQNHIFDCLVQYACGIFAPRLRVGIDELIGRCGQVETVDNLASIGAIKSNAGVEMLGAADNQIGLVDSCFELQSVTNDGQLQTRLCQSLFGQAIAIIVEIEEASREQCDRQNIDGQYSRGERQSRRPSEG